MSGYACLHCGVELRTTEVSGCPEKVLERERDSYGRIRSETRNCMGRREHVTCDCGTLAWCPEDGAHSQFWRAPAGELVIGTEPGPGRSRVVGR